MDKQFFEGLNPTYNYKPNKFTNIMKVALNIGLSNNPCNYLEIGSILNNFPIFSRVEFRVALGEYKGEKEETVIALCNINYDAFMGYEATIPRILKDVKVLCRWLNQESIAVQIDGSENLSYLVYHENYRGEKQSFNPEYFQAL